MTPMNHEQFEDLKEAYALKSLPDEEAREFEAYLEAHPELQGEIDDLTATAGLLALGCEEREPPGQLRSNILAAVEQEARQPRREMRGPSLAERLRGALGWQRLAGVAAAAAVVGLLVWNISLMGSLQDQGPQSFELVSADTSQQMGQVTQVEEGEQAVLVADSVEELPQDRAYQVWVIREGEDPISNGTFTASEGQGAAQIDTPLEGGETVAITDEPVGGSPAPTTDPAYTAEIQDGSFL